MTQRKAGLVLLAGVVLALGYGLQRRPAGPVFRGWTPARWEAEISRWECSMTISGPWPRPHGWTRLSPPWVEWLKKVGIDAEGDAGRWARWREVLPLLEGDPEAVPVLVQLLESPDVKVRLAAAEGLAAVGPAATAAAPALSKLMSDDPDPEVAFAAWYALLEMKKPIDDALPEH